MEPYDTGRVAEPLIRYTFLRRQLVVSPHRYRIEGLAGLNASNRLAAASLGRHGFSGLTGRSPGIVAPPA
jgi:hypothetical protein